MNQKHESKELTRDCSRKSISLSWLSFVPLKWCNQLPNSPFIFIFMKLCLAHNLSRYAVGISVFLCWKMPFFNSWKYRAASLCARVMCYCIMCYCILASIKMIPMCHRMRQGGAAADLCSGTSKCKGTCFCASAAAGGNRSNIYCRRSPMCWNAHNWSRPLREEPGFNLSPPVLLLAPLHEKTRGKL